ncbi:MAG TPA: hypothetical protein VFZ66_19900 [Herpetosiphonaceae bacterium]
MEIPALVVIGLVLCGLVLLATLGMGLVTLLIKLGVIVREAQKPPHLDSGDYSLEQGREVVSEDRRQ